MNVVDSSGWLEYFADGPNAPFFSRPVQNTTELIVPSITIYEVFKTVLRQRDESDALQAVALTLQGSVPDNLDAWPTVDRRKLAHSSSSQPFSLIAATALPTSCARFRSATRIASSVSMMMRSRTPTAATNRFAAIRLPSAFRQKLRLGRAFPSPSLARDV